MFKQFVVLSVLLLTSSAGFCQGIELEFRIQKTISDKPQPRIINYLINDYNRQSNSIICDTYKLYTLPDSKKFEYRPQKPQFWKGGGVPDLQFTTLDYYKNDSIISCVVFDSILGEQSFIVGGIKLNQRISRTYNWYYLAIGNLTKLNSYSVCTDTSATLLIDSTVIPCYKIESYYKTPWRLGMYREERYTTTFIAKESLLPIKMIEESSVLQIHMSIHFSAAEKREFKQKKIRSVSALNYTGNI